MGSKQKKEKKQSKVGRPPKFDYDNPEFYQVVQELASMGYSDSSIAYELQKKYGESLTPETFSRFKNEKKKNGEPTDRSKQLCQALAHGRSTLMQMARSTYFQMALGQRTVKTTTKQRIRLQDGTLTDDELISTQEMELAPNMQALATMLYNHDDEWRENILRHKQAEAEAAKAKAKELPSVVNLRITYNQKSDLELQEKFKKPSQ